MPQQKRMPTLWEVPDDLWERIEQVLNEHDPPAHTGRKRVNPRKIIDGIIFRIRTGCQWNHIPKVYGDDSTIHRTFERWVELGLFEMIWSLLQAECDELGLVKWEWQSADGSLGKAHLGGDQIGPNPTDRAKSGTKKSLLVDEAGGPLSIILAPANVNDHLVLEETIEAVAIERPAVTPDRPQHLSLDGAYNNQPSREVVAAANYQAHIRPGGIEEIDKKQKKYKARRWVVERTFAWLSKLRGLVIRYETKSQNYEALLQFACALLWYRRLPSPECGYA